MPFAHHVLAALVLILLTAPLASAQTADGGPDPNTVRVRIGPLWMNPTISMPNFGIDTNVFNDPPTVTPKKDFTITVSPKADMWLRLGRTWLSGTVSEDIVWYQKYTSERSTNNAYTVAWKAPLNRLVLGAGASWMNTRTRPGFEIDARAERTEPAYSATIEVRGFARTFIGVRGNARKVSFADTGTFQGTNLKSELDRQETSAAITLRQEVTPLTSITFSAARSEQKFKFSTLRDSKSNDYAVSVNFDPAALLKGSVTLGYTAYKPAARDVPEYKGTTAAVNLGYTLLGSTRVDGSIARHVDSSYDIDQPYYVLTGLSASIAQQIFGPVDVVARAGRQQLAYRNRDLTAAVADRTDRIRSYGFGVGFRLGRELRLGVNFDKDRRTSSLIERQYEGRKYGMSLTYVP